jgi:epoxyqueuosine reductase QueG
MDKQQLMEAARAAGADLVGVADIERFDELPEGKDPRAIFPETRSVIVLARRVNRGALRGVEEGTNFNSYQFYGLSWLDNRFTSLTTFRTAEALENAGWEAVPLPNLPPEVPPMGVSVAPDRPAPNVMLDAADAAVRAGLGEIGYCGLLLTPRFGPRQRVQMILTDAPLDPDPILAEPICPRDDSCGQICPLGALGEPTERAICGKRMTVAAIDDSRCRTCKNGAMANPYHRAGKAERMAAVCTRSCVDALERAGRLEDRFAAPFRRRDPWTVQPSPNFFQV